FPQLSRYFAARTSFTHWPGRASSNQRVASWRPEPEPTRGFRSVPRIHYHGRRLMPPPIAPRYDAVYVGDDYCGALVGPVVVIIGRDLPGPLLPEHGFAWTKRLAARYPTGCGFMIVLRSEAPPPNDDTRTRVSGFFESCSKNAMAGAIV